MTAFINKAYAFKMVLLLCVDRSQGAAGAELLRAVGRAGSPDSPSASSTVTTTVQTQARCSRPVGARVGVPGRAPQGRWGLFVHSGPQWCHSRTAALS